MLAQHFIQKKGREMGLDSVSSLQPGTLNRVTHYAWHGNVRKLENTVEYASSSKNGLLTFPDIDLTGMAPVIGNRRETDKQRPEVTKLDLVMVRHIRKVLNRYYGLVKEPNGTAKRIDIHPSTLRKPMNKLGIPYGRQRIPRGKKIRLEAIRNLP